MKLSTRLTGAMIVLVLVTTVTIGFLAYRNLETVTRTSELERERARVLHFADELDKYVGNVRADILVARDAGIEHYVTAATADSPDAAVRRIGQAEDALQRLFRAELAAKPSYLQYRLIGVADGGRELIRVERTSSGVIRVVPRDQLQQKGGRPYVQETLKLSDRGVYISPIELNREHGVIEKPHTPVLRAATPVFHPDGRTFGVLVINVNMRPVFQRLRSSARDRAHVFLTNHRGDYLVHSDRAREFRFEFGESRRWQDDLPELAARFQGDSLAGVFHDANGNRFFAAAASIRLAGQRDLVLVEAVPYSQLLAAASAVRRPVLLAGLSSVIVAALLAVWVARATASPMEQLASSVSDFTGVEAIDLPRQSYREVGVLSTAIGRMAGQVRKNTEWLNRQSLESAPIAAIMVDRAGKMVVVNALATSMFGYDRDEMLGNPVEMLIPPNIEEIHVQVRNAYMADPQPRGMGIGRDLYGRRRDGSDFPVEIGLKPIQTDDGPFVIAAINDLTERLRLEADLQHANQILERRTAELTRSNEDLEQFAYIASHDLQEPLRKIASCCEVLATEYSDRLDDEGREWLSFTMDAATRMRRLVIDLLEFSRVSTSTQSLETVDAADALRQALDNLAGAIESSGAQITVHELPRVEVVEAQLVQLFQNLVGNAIKYCEDDTPRVDIGAERDGAFWKFSVRDNGIGIAPEYHERIFVIFQRLHQRENYQGTGLGLAVCRKVVERLGGKLTVESAVGEGSTFYFTLPATDPPQFAGYVT